MEADIGKWIGREGHEDILDSLLVESSLGEGTSKNANVMGPCSSANKLCNRDWVPYVWGSRLQKHLAFLSVLAILDQTFRIFLEDVAQPGTNARMNRFSGAFHARTTKRRSNYLTALGRTESSNCVPPRHLCAIGSTNSRSLFSMRLNRRQNLATRRALLTIYYQT